MNRRILNLAVPNIISNLSIPLLSSVDTALMGHLPDPDHLEAVAVGAAVFNFIYWGFGFLRMGTTGMTAQAFGKNDSREITDLLGRGMIVALAGSLFLLLLQVPIEELAFRLIQAESEVKTLGREYFRLRILAAPATLGLYVVHGWFLGVQNARFPMYLAIITNLLNIGFNLFFLEYFDMKSDGIALGTVCAQYSGLIIGMGMLFRYKDKLQGLVIKRLFQKEEFLRFFKVNGDIMVRTLLLISVMSFIPAISGNYGENMIAVNAILMQFNTIMAYGVDGFAFASESLVGRYMGSKDKNSLRKVIRYVFAWGFGAGIFFSALFFVLHEEMFRMFTDNEAVLQLLYEYRYWVVVFPLINVAAFIWDGIYLGATATSTMRNSMIAATVFVFLPAWYFTLPLDNHGLWISYTAFMVCRGLFLQMRSRRVIFSN